MKRLLSLLITATLAPLGMANGQTTSLGEQQTFEVVPLPGAPTTGGARP